MQALDVVEFAVNVRKMPSAVSYVVTWHPSLGQGATNVGSLVSMRTMVVKLLPLSTTTSAVYMARIVSAAVSRL